jgi:class 3 adenylate cyclase
MSEAVPSEPRSTTPSAQRRHVPLALLLVGGITLLILLSVGSVLFISLREASENTISLLADKADSNLDLLEAQLATRLAPVGAAGGELALRIGEGDYDVDDADGELRHLLRGALAALPHATAVVFVATDARAVRLARFDGRIQAVDESPFLRERQEFALVRAQTLDAPTWVEPLWMPLLGEPTLSFIAPVRRGTAFFGAVVVTVRLGDLATFLAAIEAERGVRAFVLYDNRYVLGHPRLLEQNRRPGDVTGTAALPTIEAFEEDAFRLLKSDVDRARRLIELADVDDAPFDDDYIVLVREIHDYGAVPWQIGLRFDQAEVTTEFLRLRNAAIAGLVILVLAVASGYLFTRHLNRQIGRLAATAARLRDLDVGGLPPLPDSRIRELSNAAGAFNALIAAMHWFETYVPKTLVLRLMHMGDSAALSEERELTILFSDIRGFSTLVEHMDPVATAELLNRHFELLAECVEAEGGTVDKFIGDSIMAFWGAPESQADHATRALRAAAAMQRTLVRENDRRRDAGHPVVSIRIGIHTGPVVVGNIGSRNRVNYTVIGDSVNVAARLEAFAKDLAIEDDCVALLSDATLRAAGGTTPAGTGIEHLGEVAMRGREGRVEVYRLTGA